MYVSTKSSSEIEQESPTFGSESETTKHQNQQEKPPYNERFTPVAASSPEPHFTKTIFRHLITCGSADTNDSANCKRVKDSMKNKNECKDQRVHRSVAYERINGPNCSRCGKQFKPQKLHAHSKSCKGNGIKAMAKIAAINPEIAIATHEKTSKNSTESHRLVSGYLLTR
ncbi:hypothetical protein ACJIZ3_013287 [Penstemon smallii]|uniref:C2H2-type domain-containing protein n=1 Tax=Penstemon smallii TaxID=265156 RepID=A0ABD3UPT1_9LAMI